MGLYCSHSYTFWLGDIYGFVYKRCSHMVNDLVELANACLVFYIEMAIARFKR